MSPVRPIDDSYANGYANSKWAGEVLLREAHDLCRLPVAVFRSDMILAHSRYTGQLNVPDAFTRLILSMRRRASRRARSIPRPRASDPGALRRSARRLRRGINHHARRAPAFWGFRSFDVMNPHDDGVSLDASWTG